MQQVVQKESHEAVQTIYVKVKANTRVIYYVVKWMKTLSLKFLSLRLLCLIVFLFCLHFCILNPFEIIRCIVKSLIATSTFFFIEIQLKKENLKSIFWALKFGRPNRYTGLPNGLNTSLMHNVPKWSDNINAEIVVRRKCCAHLMSHNILRDI